MRDIVGLYLNPPEHAIVLCIEPTLLVGPERDELDGLGCTQAVLPLERGHAALLARHYLRNGITHLFAAFDVLQRTSLGLCVQRHRHRDFLCFLNTIDRAVTAGTAIYVVLDSYEHQKHPNVLRWLASHPRFTFHFLPTSDSWLDAVETFMSAKSGRHLRRGNLQSMVDLKAAINCYVDEHNGDPKVFIWTKTARRSQAKASLSHASLHTNVVEIKTAIRDSELRQVRKTWWIGFLSTIVVLGILISSATQERLPVNPALFAQAGVGSAPAPSKTSVGAQDPLNKAAAEVRAPLIRSLIKELIAQRLTNVQLSADLEIGGSNKELAHREAQSADATAARAELKSCGVRQARVMENAGTPSCVQETAAKAQLRERYRQFPDAWAEADELPQPKHGADADLARKRADYNGLVTGAAALETDSAAVIAPASRAVIEGERSGFHAAVGDASLDSPEPPPSGLPSSTSADALPVMPIPKPPLRGSSSAISSNTVNHGAPTSARKTAVGQDDTSIHAASPEVGVSDSEPMAVHATSATPDSIENRDRRSFAAPVVGPVTSNTSTPLLNDGYRGNIKEAAARLADGLRLTREDAISQGHERVFTVDVDNRAFISASDAEPVPLDPALNMHLLTAKSELVGRSRGGIRFFADGSSTGGRIELELLGERATINVRWATGAVTIER
jgi:hypothetical protein